MVEHSLISMIIAIGRLIDYAYKHSLAAVEHLLAIVSS